MSTYCTRADVEATFGVDNVSLYADLDNDADATKILARITLAISVASAEIDDMARGTHYAIPLVNASGSTPTSITNLASHLAGLWLYEARGGVDMDKQGNLIHRWQHLRNWADGFLRDLLNGTRKIDAV